jgi:hypothetical protein
MPAITTSTTRRGRRIMTLGRPTRLQHRRHPLPVRHDGAEARRAHHPLEPEVRQELDEQELAGDL